MLRKFRLLILLFILATVALGAWRGQNRLRAWEQTIHVAIFPIAADHAPATTRFLDELRDESFEDIGRWVQEQSDRYGRSVLRPVAIRVAPQVLAQPPSPPDSPALLDAVLWSLKMRWWARQHDTISGPKPHIRLYVLFHDPEKNPVLPHSTGLAKGQIGLVHAYASRQQGQQNAVVLAHEMLHIFGASDKYDPANLQPIYPNGYAEPGRDPRLPQGQAEIMAGRIPVDALHAVIPDSLADTVIGPATAREIGLLRPAD